MNNMVKKSDLRERVYCFYNANKDQGKAYTVKHFEAEKERRTTIYRIIQRIDDGIPMVHQRGAGRPAVKMPKDKIRHMKRLFNNKRGISQRKAAAKYKVTQQYIQNLLKTKTDIRCRKRIKIPKRTDKQKVEGRTKCSTMCRKIQDVEIVQDDETYLTFSHSSINGNDNFYTSNIEETPADVKFKTKAKFEPKLLVYSAISSRGVSKPAFFKSGYAINAETYKTKCLRRILLPFIHKHHSDGNYLFWPDLASSHYAESVTDFMIENNINYVEKYDNPANIPEVRPIESFWSLFKAEVYKDGWEAKNLKQLENRARSCIMKVDPTSIQRLFSGLPRSLDKIRRYGVIESKK